MWCSENFLLFFNIPIFCKSITKFPCFSKLLFSVMPCQFSVILKNGRFVFHLSEYSRFSKFNFFVGVQIFRIFKNHLSNCSCFSKCRFSGMKCQFFYILKIFFYVLILRRITIFQNSVFMFVLCGFSQFWKTKYNCPLLRLVEKFQFWKTLFSVLTFQRMNIFKNQIFLLMFSNYLNFEKSFISV